MNGLPLLRNITPDRSTLWIDSYERSGGYAAARKAITEMDPASVLELVKESGLRGRGGAGFPTGQKWSFVPRGEDAPRPVYLVANADEMEPGTFKDRLLMECDPHQLIEGMIVSAYAIRADIGFIFLRYEYAEAEKILARAIREAYGKQYLGKNVFGSPWSLEMHLHVSAGRYLCGEETALLNSLEGKRATPRSKPPFPQTSGLWGKPTIVNNVETLCNIPHIIRNGAAWYKTLSRSRDTGTKLYGASGRVKRPGIWELPMGVTIRELLEEHAGGMQDGYRFRGLLPGGASTDFLVGDHLDVKMDFDSLQKAGSRLGTGTMIILDDRTCPVGFCLNLEHFFAQESCGWCTPCWSGLQWAEQILQTIEDGKGRMEDIDRLTSITGFIAPGHTYCAHAPGAAEPLQSAIKYFRDDFERHIREKKCPWR